MKETRPRIFDEAYLVKVQCVKCGAWFDAISNMLYWRCPECGKFHDNDLDLRVDDRL